MPNKYSQVIVQKIFANNLQRFTLETEVVMGVTEGLMKNRKRLQPEFDSFPDSGSTWHVTNAHEDTGRNPNPAFHIKKYNGFPITTKEPHQIPQGLHTCCPSTHIRGCTVNSVHTAYVSVH